MLYNRVGASLLQQTEPTPLRHGCDRGAKETSNHQRMERQGYNNGQEQQQSDQGTRRRNEVDSKPR